MKDTVSDYDMVLLQEDAGLTPESYVKRHPGGSLGKLRDNEK